MNIFRIIAVIVIIVLAVPLIMISVSGSGTTASTKVTTTSNAAVAVTPATAPVTEAEPIDPATWLRNRTDLSDTYSVNELNGDRIVVIEEIITEAALIGTDESAPADTFRDLYAAARAPARLISYCTDVIQTIGTKCDVIYSDVRENAQGKLELTGHLAFVPEAALGDPSQIASGSVVKGKITLPYDGDLKPANTAETRTIAMQQAQAMCDRLREDHGNCVLTNVTFDIEELWITDLEVLPAGTNPQRLETSATFQVYANRSTLSQNQLLDQLRELAGR